jgi:asparagine synthetase B (glutamine-hydrolysing)
VSQPLRPLMNLLAIHDADPRRMQELQIELEASGVFAVVKTAGTWLLALAPLEAGTKIEDPDTERLGLAFAEGRELFADRAELSRLAACAEREPERLDQFGGDFGFTAVTTHSELRAVRACGGTVPFFYRRHGSRSMVATRLGFFARFSEDTPALDPLVAATWATAIDFFPDGRALLSGVRVLERGHALCLDAKGALSVVRYWRPRPGALPKPSTARAREHADAMRSILVSALERDLDPGGANLLTLSGGVDSSSLAALTGKLGIPITTLSFLPEDERLFARENAHVQRALRSANVTARRIVRLGAESWFQLQQRAPPSAMMILHPALCSLPEVARELGTRVLFGGEFADVVCGSTPTLKDWAAETGPIDLLLGLRALPNGRSDIADWLRYKVRLWQGLPYTRFPRDLGSMIHPVVRAEYAEWSLARSRQVAADPLPRPALPLYAEHVGFVAQNWEVCSSLGIRRLFPFFSRQALELGYACHTSELVGPGSKKLLRSALQREVPPEILGRTDRGFWGPALKEAVLPWSTPLEPELSSIIRDDWLPEPPARVRFLDALALQALVNILAGLRTERLKSSLRR